MLYRALFNILIIINNCSLNIIHINYYNELY